MSIVLQAIFISPLTLVLLEQGQALCLLEPQLLPTGTLCTDLAYGFVGDLIQSITAFFKKKVGVVAQSVTPAFRMWGVVEKGNQSSRSSWAT